jgi:hypothetical protein
MFWYSLQRVANYKNGPLAQLVEHLTLNQGVTGSRPVWPTIFFARVAELADALDLGSSGVTPVGVQIPPLAPYNNHLS